MCNVQQTLNNVTRQFNVQELFNENPFQHQ